MVDFVLSALVLLGFFVIYLINEKDSPVLKFLIHKRCYFLYHVILCCYTWFMGNFGQRLKDKSFLNFMNSYGPIYAPEANHYKKTLFSPLTIETKRLTILEVGAGPGTNFQFYPKSCDLIVVDPGEVYKENLEANLAKFEGIHLKEYHSISAENISTIPDNSVDVVITTEVLCSFDNHEPTLREIRRVLKPSGTYYFLEHILDRPGTLVRKIQDLLIYTGLWKFWMSGCRFFQEPDSLRQVGFSDVKTNEIFLRFKEPSILRLVAPHIIGVATK